VVIPSRNCLSYLPAALESVHLQCVGAEVIVVDDGSTDGTWEWLTTGGCQLGTNSHLRPIRLDGTGVQRARNRGIQEARAPLVAFLDADDRWRAGKLAGQLAFHRAHPETLLSFTDYLHVDPEGGHHGSCFSFWTRFARRLRSVSGWRQLGPDAAALVLAENVIGTSTVVARRDVLAAVGGFDDSLASASDWDLWLKVTKLGRVACTDDVLVDYRIRRAGSISCDYAARIRSMEMIVARHGPALAADHPWSIRAAMAHLAAARAEGSRAEGRLRAALVDRLAALALAPSRRTVREAAAEVVGLAMRPSPPRLHRGP
jgi:glycosyltransferase involved in cell wall biosynthesis